MYEINHKSLDTGLRFIFRFSAFLVLSHIFVMKQNQLRRAINNLGTNLLVSKHGRLEHILDLKGIYGIVGFDISARFKEMDRETRTLFLLFLLQLPSIVHSLRQEIHTRSVYNHDECTPLDFQEWCGCKPIQTHPGGS